MQMRQSTKIELSNPCRSRDLKNFSFNVNFHNLITLQSTVLFDFQDAYVLHSVLFIPNIFTTIFESFFIILFFFLIF